MACSGCVANCTSNFQRADKWLLYCHVIVYMVKEYLSPNSVSLLRLVPTDNEAVVTLTLCRKKQIMFFFQRSRMSAWLSVQTASYTNGEDPERRFLFRVDEVRLMVRTAGIRININSIYAERGRWRGNIGRDEMIMAPV